MTYNKYMEKSNNYDLINDTFTNPGQQYNQDSLPNKNTRDNQQIKLKKYRKVIVIFIFFILAICLLNTIRESFSGPSISEYQKYLEDKYGKNENFSYTGRHGTNGCPMFNAGFCEQLFTSEKSNKEFKVIYNKHSTSKFSDQYYLAKYEKEFEKYYYEKYGKFLKDIIPYDYNISLDVIYPSFGPDKKQTSFTDVVHDVENDEIYKWSKPDIIINIDYKAIDTTKIEYIDYDSMKLQINNLIQENKIQLQNKATIELKINMGGAGRTGMCPDGFDTIGNGSYNTNKADEEIISCLKVLYEKKQ